MIGIVIHHIICCNKCRQWTKLTVFHPLQRTVYILDPNLIQNASGPFLMIAMVAVFVFLIILPQRRRDKKVKQMLADLKPGDRIRTIGGIYGRIVSIKDDVATIEVGPDKVRLVFTRGAIATVEDSDVENSMTEEIKADDKK